MKDLAMHIMDIAQNALTAQAHLVKLCIDESKPEKLHVTLTDDGVGMSEEMLSKVTDPYTTSRKTRNVGLGIPLLKQNAERTGGTLGIQSKEGKGTSVRACFIQTHLDCLPLGDIAGTVVLLMGANPEVEFEYTHKFSKGNYSVKSTEIKEMLGETPISEAEVLRFLKEMIHENITEIRTK